MITLTVQNPRAERLLALAMIVLGWSAPVYSSPALADPKTMRPLTPTGGAAGFGVVRVGEDARSFDLGKNPLIPVMTPDRRAERRAQAAFRRMSRAR